MMYIIKIFKERINIFEEEELVPLFFWERTIETPTIKIKNGKTKSVNVISNNTPIHIGPITLGMHYNPYGENLVKNKKFLENYLGKIYKN